MWRWGLFVNNESPNAEEMWAFIHFMIQDVNEVRDEVGYIPSLKGWLDNPDNYEKEPWLEIQKADLDIGIPVPQTPKYGEVAQQILEMTERVYSGAQSVSDSVAEACGRIDTILAE
jgi:ABC-type glycerol-3-phosphate transport system substrate-binding protein